MKKKSLVKREPVGVLALVAVAVVSAAAKFGVGLETDTVETLIADGIIVATAIAQRQKVTPVQ